MTGMTGGLRLVILAAQRRGRPSALPLRAAGIPPALETAVLASFPWLPPEVSKRIRFR